MIGYHSLMADWRTYNGPARRKPWKVGADRRTKYASMCIEGYHFCPKLIHVLGYISGPIICKVNVTSQVHVSGNKGVGRRRRLLAGADCSEELVEFMRLCLIKVLEHEGAWPDMKYLIDVVDPRAYLDPHYNAILLSSEFQFMRVQYMWACKSLREGNKDEAMARLMGFATRLPFPDAYDWADKVLHSLIDKRLGIC